MRKPERERERDRWRTNNASRVQGTWEEGSFEEDG